MRFSSLLGIAAVIGLQNRVHELTEATKSKASSEPEFSGEDHARLVESLANLDRVRISDQFPLVEGQPDPLYEQAVTLLREAAGVSVAALQDHFGMGYSRSRLLLDELVKNDFQSLLPPEVITEDDSLYEHVTNYIRLKKGGSRSELMERFELSEQRAEAIIQKLIVDEVISIRNPTI